MKWLQIGQLAIAVLLIAAVLLQNRGSGLSEVFGGSGGVYRTKRGLEKILFWATIVLGAMFFGISVLIFAI